MANPTTGMFQTLVAAASAASQNLVYANSFVDAVYWDYQPVVATPYTTLNVLIPTVNEGNVVDIQAGPIQPVDYSYNQVAITFDKHFSESFVIKSWDQIRTPADLERLFVRPAFEALLRKVNRTLAGFAQNASGYFNSYSTVTGTSSTQSSFARADLTGAWTNLTNAGVPVDDEANMSLIVTPRTYGLMLADTTFSYQYIVGDANQQAAMNAAKLRTLYGINVKYDQHLTIASAGSDPALMLHRYAIACVTANPPSNDSPAVEETIVMVRDRMPVQVQMAYSLQDQGWVVHLHFYWGAKVARPEMGQYMTAKS
jgi:hypothetical protein